jgi:hypothetical protein
MEGDCEKEIAGTIRKCMLTNVATRLRSDLRTEKRETELAKSASRPRMIIGLSIAVRRSILGVG